MDMAQVESRQTGRGRSDVLQMLEQRTQSAQNELACRDDAGDDVLNFLAHEGAPATRRAVAANLAAPAHANRHLAEDDDEEVRAELARKIGRLMPGLSAREAEHIEKLTIETLERLAKDQVTRVRSILAEEIKHLDCIPSHVVQALARDVEETVCVPILEYSPLLSDADLIEIIAEGKVHAVLSAIARRKPVSAAVSDAVVSALDIPSVATLLANPDAAIRERTLDAIIQQAERISVWQDAICMRADLSRRAIKRLASFVSAELLERLSSRHGLDESTKLHLSRQLRARCQEGEVASAPRNSAAEEVEAAAKAGRLDDAFIEGAVDTGKREVVTLALSKLAKLPDSLVRRILMTRSAKPLTALVWRSGLGMRSAFKIQRFVMKLPADELLPARNGTYFPMTEDEMRWHLGYFGVAE